MIPPSRAPSPISRSLALLAASIAVLAAAIPSPAAAQTDEEPLYDALVRHFQREELRIGAVIQAVGGFEWGRATGDERRDGFELGAVRLQARGQLDGGFGYMLQTEFTSDPVVLDAVVSHRFSNGLNLRAGMFKAPFSAELLIAAPSIDLINRSRVVSQLAPARQIGVSLGGTGENDEWGYEVGIFNGNGRDLGGNDGDGLLGVLRVRRQGELRGGRLELAVNAAVGSDDDVSLLGQSFRGDRRLAGIDARWENERWMASGELIAADLDRSGGSDVEPWGMQTTLAHRPGSVKHQVLLRWDAFDGGDGRSDLLILGYNHWPTSPFEIQLNYLIPVGDGAEFDDQELLANFQVAF